jgi:hypothetical protein
MQLKNRPPWLLVSGIAIELQPWSPIFEKCSHLREKGGVLTLKTTRGVCAYPYSTKFSRAGWIQLESGCHNAV